MRRKLAGAFALVMYAAAACAATPPDRWVEARSTHFVVLTNSSVRDARRVASQFERIHLVFHTLLPTRGDDANPPLMVVVLKDKKGMEALEPESYLGKRQVDPAGFFVRAPEKNYILMRLDVQEQHPYAAVYHEYTHYMLRKVENWLPAWLNEGLSEFYENTDTGGKYVWLGQTNAEDLRDLRREEMLPITTLLRSPLGYRDEQAGPIFNPEAWALVHYLTVSDHLLGTHRLRDYTQYLMRGEESLTAARHAFGDLGKLEVELGNYVRQRNFTSFAMTSELSAKDASMQVLPVATSTANAVRADVMIYLQRPKEARTLLDAVLRDDPGNGLAHESMGMLRSREGDVAGAKKWYAEAVGLDSQSYLARYYFATTALRAGSGNDDAVERELKASIDLNPEFAPAYDALAMFYVSRRGWLEEAQALSLRAIELAPDRLGYRLNYAAVLAEERQTADALEVLKRALPLAKSAIEVDAVESRIGRLERERASMDGAGG